MSDDYGLMNPDEQWSAEDDAPHGAEVAPGVRSWASILDDKTLEQAARSAAIPVVHQPIALMPDAHYGYGATVGSVIATEGAIIPSAVGVDIGCGMAAVDLGIPAAALPDNIDQMLSTIARAVPAGVGQAHAEGSARVADADIWFAEHPPPTELSEKDAGDARRQFGTLGGGNHFVEVCVDENDAVWVVLHSGSRGIGNRLATRHIDAAKAQPLAHDLEDPDLAWFVQHTPAFDRYIADMLWAQDYAHANRAAMLYAILRDLAPTLIPSEPVPIYWSMGEVINCHHNYAVPEVHDGRMLWVTRKGAIRAGAGDLGIIPGSMGAGTFIVRGVGNPASYESCSHGAGRQMSRTAARKALSPESLIEAMGTRMWQVEDAAELTDEHPDAYKSIDTVMADQADLVDVVHRLTQVVNYKGVDRRPIHRRRRSG